LRAKRSNLFDSSEIASSLTLLAMTRNDSVRELPGLFEKLRFAHNWNGGILVKSS
jgi:hypothetical protein